MDYEVNVTLRPSGLTGISEEQIAQHWRLYEGYVAQVNTLRAELESLRKSGKGESALYADRRRRLGFEYNGMVLHELYFANLKADVPELSGTSALKKALTGQFGSFATFEDDFVAAGTTRSVGWALLCLDPMAGALNNHFVQLHEDGHVAGSVPLLVLDVWEHAYMVDHGAGGRHAYIRAFLSNVNWHVVERRYHAALTGQILSRDATAAHVD